jgi:hypothetical protein
LHNTDRAVHIGNGTGVGAEEGEERLLLNLFLPSVLLRSCLSLSLPYPAFLLSHLSTSTPFPLVFPPGPHTQTTCVCPVRKTPKNDTNTRKNAPVESSRRPKTSEPVVNARQTARAPLDKSNGHTQHAHTPCNFILSYVVY